MLKNLRISYVIAAALIGAFPVLGDSPGKDAWVAIHYGDAVDDTVLTHKGETIGEIVEQLPQSGSGLRGMVQPYLEPFSVLCHDVILMRNGPDSLPLVNITDHYPKGSRQPAWVALFREGRYQLYYNRLVVRVFLKGKNPKGLIDKHHGVVRHALRDVLERKRKTLKSVEVYAFENDFARRAIQLNTVPALYSAAGIDLSPRRRPIDLAGIQYLLEQGVLLEAAEVDGKPDLYMYGIKSANHHLAGHPISIADLAVAYRSLFHYGWNTPYVSLDRSEDNRFAKVNFGGHLENTRMGHVLLEADKLFKTLSTGLDPNTRVTSRYLTRSRVPGFTPKNHRLLLDSLSPGESTIRFWFYPDSLGTVTNGLIGAVVCDQMWADVERTDEPTATGEETRKTITHLNNGYSLYAKAASTYAELKVVGRMMALMHWLKDSKADQRLELDEFLSVPLPAFKTAERTRKMLVVTAVRRPVGNWPEVSTVMDEAHVFHLTDLLDAESPFESESHYMRLAAETVLKRENLAPVEYNELLSQAETHKQGIEDGRKKVTSLKAMIQSRKKNLDRTSSEEVERYNALIVHYKKAVKLLRSETESYNAIVRKLNNMELTTRQITSIAGGIGLDPSQFRKVSRNPKAEQLKTIQQVKAGLTPSGRIAVSNNWVRNRIGKPVAQPNTLPRHRWDRKSKKAKSREFDYISASGGNAQVRLPGRRKTWLSETKVGHAETSIEIHERGVATIRHSSLNHDLSVKEFSSTSSYAFAKLPH